MKKLEWLMTAAMLGAGAVYFLDPRTGRQRQAMVRDKITKFSNEKREAVDVMVKDFSNRSKGVMHEVHDKFEEVALHAKQETPPSEANWTPAASLVVGSAGAYLVLKGLWKRHMWGGILFSIGLAMVAKSFSETEAQIHPGREAEGEQPQLLESEGSMGESAGAQTTRKRTRQAAMH